MKRATRYRINAFWQRHKYMHRAVLLLVALPFSIVWALPVAIAAACGEIRYSIGWIGESWKRSDKPWAKWAEREKAEHEDLVQRMQARVQTTPPDASL